MPVDPDKIVHVLTYVSPRERIGINVDVLALVVWYWIVQDTLAQVW